MRRWPRGGRHESFLCPYRDCMLDWLHEAQEASHVLYPHYARSQMLSWKGRDCLCLAKTERGRDPFPDLLLALLLDPVRDLDLWRIHVAGSLVFNVCRGG